MTSFEYLPIAGNLKNNRKIDRIMNDTNITNTINDCLKLRFDILHLFKFSSIFDT